MTLWTAQVMQLPLSELGFQVLRGCVWSSRRNCYQVCVAILRVTFQHDRQDRWTLALISRFPERCRIARLLRCFVLVHMLALRARQNRRIVLHLADMWQGWFGEFEDKTFVAVLAADEITVHCTIITPASSGRCLEPLPHDSAAELHLLGNRRVAQAFLGSAYEAAIGRRLVSVPPPSPVIPTRSSARDLPRYFSRK
jgi:hypothetical protein